MRRALSWGRQIIFLNKAHPLTGSLARDYIFSYLSTIPGPEWIWQEDCTHNKLAIQDWGSSAFRIIRTSFLQTYSTIWLLDCRLRHSSSKSKQCFNGLWLVFDPLVTFAVWSRGIPLCRSGTERTTSGDGRTNVSAWSPRRSSVLSRPLTIIHQPLQSWQYRSGMHLFLNWYGTAGATSSVFGNLHHYVMISKKKFPLFSLTARIKMTVRTKQVHLNPHTLCIQINCVFPFWEI